MTSPIGATKYGMLSLGQSAAAPAAAAPAASNGAVTNANTGTGTSSKWTAVLSPSTAEAWVIGIGAAMFGLIAVSTSVRVGKMHVSAGVGDT